MVAYSERIKFVEPTHGGGSNRTISWSPSGHRSKLRPCDTRRRLRYTHIGMFDEKENISCDLSRFLGDCKGMLQRIYDVGDLPRLS
ncbi:hypothetical protein TorRG33x02_323320 [Trema orientale]|uniref:Uncharacterized protein n=1 Tax=Trema orientale TaxID=63057 RepID=A0A2P5BF46_TREOI|nr:hypothetical protein TorRG33x02_323320 [Trema orientale]